MKKLASILSIALLASSAGTAMASGETKTPQSDEYEAAANTVMKKSVKYRCQNGKRTKVTYGFNKQGLPTYAQAYINGKTRFMPVNLYHSDIVSSAFGDENNFSLMSDVITAKNYRKSHINIQSPSSEIVYKGCTAH